MNGPTYFEIQADDVGRAVDFYREIFGWTITRDESLPIEYWRIDTRGAHGGILPRPAPIAKMPAGTNAYVCSFQTENFDELSEKILKLGGQVALPKFAVPGLCWQGYFLDTENNTFGVYEPDSQAK